MSIFDAILRNAQKSGTFVGTTARDEDAYYAFFGKVHPVIAGPRRTVDAVRQGMRALMQRAQAGRRQVAGFVLKLSAIASRKTPLTHDR